MRRFTPLDIETSSLDEDVRALMEDIDASLADFAQRLEAERENQRRNAPTAGMRIALPEIAAPEPAVTESKAETPAVEPALKRTAESPADTGLLAELEREARQKAGDDAGNPEARKLRDRRIHESLERAFRFFDVFSRHANALAPAIARSYPLDGQPAYANLQWREAIVRSRRHSLSESALLDNVAFRVYLMAPAPVSVTVRWNKLKSFRKDMHILDLATADGLEVNESVEEGDVTLQLSPRFPLQVTFRANYESGRIDILSRNLDGFGIAAFACAPDEITQEFLDGIGRFLLARSHTLPAALRRVHRRAEL
jgi:hypothetical protein